MIFRGVAAVALWIGWYSSVAADAPVLPVRDVPFSQEVARRIAMPPSSSAGVSLLDVTPGGKVRFLAAGRWWEVSGDGAVEIESLRCQEAGEFVFADAQDAPVRVALPWAEVFQILRRGNTQWIATPADPFMVENGRLSSVGWPSRWEVRQIALDPSGALWVASSGGVFKRLAEGWQAMGIPDGQGRGWAVEDVGGIAFDAAGNPWIALRAGIVTRQGEHWRFFEGRDGLPYNDFTSVAVGTDGDMWFGTHLGVIRYDGSDFAYREGPRWMPGDDVRGVAVDGEGTAWLATGKGLGGIAKRRMTLAEKARFYEDEIEKYIKRTEYGFTSEVNLKSPGDRSVVVRGDSDNDGLWTAMYGAGECFAWASGRDPASGQRAKAAFEALRFLQKVTQGGEHSPPRGYVARTVRSVDDGDPNEGRLEADRRERESGDRQWKVYEPRWPKSADGRWYWKSDTSSDELDGHYFFYARYFDLVEDDAGKDRVREVVRDLTDHLVNHGFRLIDHDGEPTRWGVFDPGHLNEDPNWWVERGLNSLSILSYLAVAEHITGDARYGAVSRDLIERHGYGANIMNPKTQSGVGSGNQSDDEMAFMCFYNLLSYSKETRWLERWRYAFHAYAALELPERNPFFQFAYAAKGRGQTYHNAWGDYPLEPWSGWLEDSLATLRGFPLDRINWPQRNSHRLDLQNLPGQQSGDLYAPRTRGRGQRVDGRVLPVAERYFTHWNTDPWRLDYGGDGRELASGAVFLLPYYMGRYHGFID